jgi:hypothetical protein
MSQAYRAHQLFRIASPRNALDFARTTRDFSTPDYVNLDSSFFRDHSHAQICAASEAWKAAHISEAKLLKGPQDGNEELLEPLSAAKFLLANEQLGDARLAAEQLTRPSSGSRTTEPASASALQLLADTRLREGETRNCVHHNNPDRCIWPLRDAAVHSDPEPARAAAGIYAELAARDPGDFAMRWRAGISSRLAGLTSEQGAPQPAARWTNPTLRLPPFPDVAVATGLRVPRAAGGTVLDDFDEDGNLDVLLLSFLTCDPVVLMHNTGDGSFEDVSEEGGLGSQLGGFNVAQADVNNDGHLDVMIVRSGWNGPGRNSLLLGDGHGHFEDVTSHAGLDLHNDATMAVAFADYDNDGWVDMFLANNSMMDMPGSRSRLYRNRGDGTFEEKTEAAGLPSIHFATGAAWGDYDNDGFPDLYVSTIGGPNLLYHNNGDGTFTEVTMHAGVGLPLVSFATWFFDYDNDGQLDLFAESFWVVLADEAKALLTGESSDPVTWPRLYHNRGDGTFEDATKAAGLDVSMSGMGANFGDIDADGWLDFFIGTGTPSLSHLVPKRLFRNVDGKRFEDETFNARVGQLQKGHGVAFGDVDGDGAPDLLINLGGAVAVDRFGPALFHNPMQGLHTVEVRLRGTRSNAAAIGARLSAYLPGGRRIERVVSSGGSFGASPLRQSIGLGSATRIERLEIRWPSGLHEEIHGLESGSSYRIVEGQDRAELVERARP